MYFKFSLSCFALLMITSIGTAVQPSFWADTERARSWSSLDLLYWIAHEEALVLTNKTSPVFTTSDFTIAPVLHPQFNWNLGFRLGFGFSPDCSPYEAALEWVYYQTNVRQKRLTNSNDLTNVNGQEGMFPIWALSDDIIAGDYVSDAFLNWGITLNMIDLTFGQTMLCFECLEIYPYIGLRGAWINQNAHIRYEGGIFLYDIIEGGVSRNGIDFIRMKNNFWGVGPRIGIEPRLYFCNGFSLFGNAAISGLGGAFYVKQTERFVDFERFAYNKNSACIRGIADLAAGISFERNFCNDSYSIRWELSWEYHIFLSQLQLKRDAFHLISSNRNLSVQGVTLSGSIGY